jgi:hypothetical protein
MLAALRSRHWLSSISRDPTDTRKSPSNLILTVSGALASWGRAIVTFPMTWSEAPLPLRSIPVLDAFRQVKH